MNGAAVDPPAKPLHVVINTAPVGDLAPAAMVDDTLPTLQYQSVLLTLNGVGPALIADVETEVKAIRQTIPAMQIVANPFESGENAPKVDFALSKLIISPGRPGTTEPQISARIGLPYSFHVDNPLAHRHLEALIVALRQKGRVVRWSSNENSERTNIVEIKWRLASDGPILYNRATFKKAFDLFIEPFGFTCVTALDNGGRGMPRIAEPRGT